MIAPLSVAEPALFQKAFLDRPQLKSLMEALGGKPNEVRVIGGAVRNALRGLAVSDVDLATSHKPKEVIARAEAAGFKTAPTGIAHGTITVIGRQFICEATTLREDIKTDGRRALVRFGANWQRDAERRDFTMNALSVDREGRLYDPVGGLEDCLAGRVRFIGNPAKRIAEDALRILRFLRFSAHYGQGPLDEQGLRAAAAQRGLLTYLSVERIGQEIKKCLAAPDPEQLTLVMKSAAKAGLLPHLALSEEEIALLAEAARPDPLLRLALLLRRQPQNLAKLTRALRFSNQEAARLQKLLECQKELEASASHPPRSIRALAYRFGLQSVEEAAYLASRASMAPEADHARLIKPLENWALPRFPLAGGDIKKLGVPPGPKLGKILKTLEQSWIDSDFQKPRASLLEEALRLV